jgi:hypothetical protein
MTEQVTEFKPVAIVRHVSTRWGEGRTCCFLCGSGFDYSLMPDATIPHVAAEGLCNCTAAPGGHYGTCYALGGDLCPNCEETVRYHPECIPGLLKARRRGLRERLAKLEAWSVAVWEYEPPSEPPF